MDTLKLRRVTQLGLLLCLSSKLDDFKRTCRIVVLKERITQNVLNNRRKNVKSNVAFNEESFILCK